MRPAQVLDHKADLIERLKHPVLRRVWTEQLAMDQSVAYDTRPERARANGAAMVENLRRILPQAECFHVAADMTTLVEHVSSTLDPTDRWDARMAPTRTGLARFEKPLRFTDIRGQSLLVSWLGWAPVLIQSDRHDQGEPSEHLGLYLWNDHVEAPDAVAHTLMGVNPPYDEIVGRWGFIGTESPTNGARMGEAMLDPGPRKRAEVLADGQVPTEFTNILRLVHSFFFLLGQTTTQASDADLDRQTRKRAGRAALPARVVVVELRRTAGSRSDGESLVEWSHRWVVRGHLRWQPYGAREVDHEHVLGDQWVEDGIAGRNCTQPGCDHYVRRLWIAPFIKGPEGAPLVTSQKVYSLVR